MKAQDDRLIWFKDILGVWIYLGVLIPSLSAYLYAVITPSSSYCSIMGKLRGEELFHLLCYSMNPPLTMDLIENELVRSEVYFTSPLLFLFSLPSIGILLLGFSFINVRQRWPLVVVAILSYLAAIGSFMVYGLFPINMILIDGPIFLGSLFWIPYLFFAAVYFTLWRRQRKRI